MPRPITLIRFTKIWWKKLRWSQVFSKNKQTFAYLHAYGPSRVAIICLHIFPVGLRYFNLFHLVLQSQQLTNKPTFSLLETTRHTQRNRVNPKSHGKVVSRGKHRILGIKEEPLHEKTPSRKQLAYNEASSSLIKNKLDDSLGRIPWSNNNQDVASYVDGAGGLSQQKLMSIMNQLTNDIRVNGRRITPLQTQIVQQSSNGIINPTSTMNDLQDEMQPDMQNNMQDDMDSNKPNDMQNDMAGNEIKPIEIPMNQNSKVSNGGQATRPGMFERLMFGGLSQIMGGGGGGGGGGGDDGDGGGRENKGYSDFGGGMTNVPGLSFGGPNNNGVINLMESENGLKPMRGMNGMHGMMMNGMGGMRGRMWGGGSFFSRRGETISHKQKARTKQKPLDQKAKTASSISNKQPNKTHQAVPDARIHIDPSHGIKQDIIPSFVNDPASG